MSVSPGGALIWSAALHALGVGFAGWATHGPSREPPSAFALHPARAQALQYLALTRPTPRPEPAAARSRRPSPRSRPARPAERLEATRLPLRVQEPAAGEVAAIRQVVARAVPKPSPTVTRRVDRGAALVSGAGSACPALPLPAAWSGRDLAVSVEMVVDSNGRVDRSALRVVESATRAPPGHAYYPRIYVVGARLEKQEERLDAAGYDAMLTEAVIRHVARLTFRPAMKNGRPVSSTVLIACQRSTDG